jgi:GNAT superfamily N-acetyltransferase
VIVVRRARLDDAPAMSAVLIASITELCEADHRNDPQLLAGWRENKSPERVAQWFESPASTLLVAERNGEIAAVGGYFASGRVVSLNYVAPAHRFAGVSTALLAAIEAGLGSGEASLESTQTARRFYECRGWHVVGDLAKHRGIDGYPMRKLLG